MEIRLQKYLAERNIASRRKAEEFISAGLVQVNGQVITQMGAKIDPDKDRVSYKGEDIEGNTQLAYYMIHKPKGCVSSVNDQFARPVVTDLINSDVRLYPVGRLDYNTTGLLILTNDGELTYRLTHPKHNVCKEYIAKLKGCPDEEKLRRFREGLEIDGHTCAPAEIHIIKTENGFSTVTIKIWEGKNRQIRKMCEKIGHEVVALSRIATGNVRLGALKTGEYRKLTCDEILYLKSL